MIKKTLCLIVTIVLCATSVLECRSPKESGAANTNVIVDVVFSLEGRVEQKEAIRCFFALFSERYPHIEIDMHFLMTDNECVVRTQLLSEAGGHQVVAFLRDKNTVGLSARGKIEIYEESILYCADVNLERYYPFLMANSVYNGYLWCMPYFSNPTVVYYDASKEFIASNIGEKPSLNRLADVHSAYPTQLSVGISSMDILIDNFCESPMNYAPEELHRESSFLEISEMEMGKLVGYIQSGLININEPREANDAFLQRKTNVLIAGFDQWNKIIDGADFPVKAVPFYNNNGRIAPATTECIYVLKPAKEEAWELVSWLTEEGNSTQLARILCSAALGSSQTMEYIKDANQMVLATNAYDNYSAMCVYEYPKVKRLLERMIENIIKDTDSWQSEFIAAKRQIDIILDTYRS